MNSVQIPWGAWYGDEAKILDFPSQANVRIADIPYRPPLSSESISDEFEQISSLVSAKIPASIVIVVDDLTRPLKMETVVNVLLDKLQTAGVEKDKIKILIGGGGHRPLSDEDVAKKLGRGVVENYPVFNHSPFRDLADLPL
ncbi:MAG: lactate racemase domain-containing protein, partial [Calditrichia bacterium]